MHVESGAYEPSVSVIPQSPVVKSLGRQQKQQQYIDVSTARQSGTNYDTPYVPFLEHSHEDKNRVACDHGESYLPSGDNQQHTPTLPPTPRVASNYGG
ncbi:MAG: hypothetical protein ABW185_28975, partial [Sedimenticola sp.]